MARDRLTCRYHKKERRHFKEEIAPNRKRVHAMEWLHERKIVFDILPDDKTAEEVANSSFRIQALACLTYLEAEPEKESISLWQIAVTLLSGAFGFILARAPSILSRFQAPDSEAIDEALETADSEAIEKALETADSEAVETALETADSEVLGAAFKSANRETIELAVESGSIEALKPALKTSDYVAVELIVIAPVLAFVLSLALVWMINRKNNHIRVIAAWAKSWSTAIKEFKPDDRTIVTNPATNLSPTHNHGKTQTTNSHPTDGTSPLVLP